MTSAAWGSSSSQAPPPSGAPCLLTMTGSTTSGKRNEAAARATARTIAGDPSAPVLAAAGGMSSITAASCSSTRSSGRISTRETRAVFCTVTSVTTASPYTPNWWNVLRSAWMPAPPLGSDPAMVRATGRIPSLYRTLKKLSIHSKRY